MCAFVLKLHCCGGQGYTDYKDSEWSNNLQINDNVGFKQDNIAPLSCCSYYDRNKDTQDTSFQTCPICMDQPSGQNIHVCSYVNPNIWKKVHAYYIYVELSLFVGKQCSWVTILTSYLDHCFVTGLSSQSSEMLVVHEH